MERSNTTLALVVAMVSGLAISSEVETMRHAIAAGEAGNFCGWPANNGVWTWDGGREILVGYTLGEFVEQKGHNMKGVGEWVVGLKSCLARSTDGGLTWKSEYPANYVSEKQTPVPSPGGFAYQAPGFALRVVGTGYHGAHDGKGSFFVSDNRGKSWKGPYQFNGLMEDLNLKDKECTARTAYWVTGPQSCLFFMSARPRETNPGVIASDKSFVAETTDGGTTFRFVSWIVPWKDPYRAVMPAVSQLKDGALVATLRRRDFRKGSCWVDAYGSYDKGRTWTFLNRVGETGKDNGNPPALAALEDGRLACVYGDRTRMKLYGRLSSDGGKTWGEEVVLRNDFQPDTFGDKDFGYPRLAVNHTQQIVALYYWATQALPQQHIAVTLWNPQPSHGAEK